MTEAPSAHPRAGKRQRVLYFVQGEQLGLIKIGSTFDLGRRLKLLQTGSPDHLKLIGVMAPRCAWSLEYELHRRFAAHRQHGEWFAPAQEVTAFISENARIKCDHARQDLIDSALSRVWATRGEVYQAPGRGPME